MSHQPIWSPDPTTSSNSQLTLFQRYVKDRYQRSIDSYHDLHRWSVQNRGLFWRAVIDFCGVIYHQEPVANLIDQGHMIDAQWFPGMTLNFAENLLKHQGKDTAIHFADHKGTGITIKFMCKVLILNDFG